MNSLDFSIVLRKNLRERMNDLADYVARGDCKSIEEYRHVTGQILGISLAERDLLDLQDKVKQRQDTDE